MNIPPKNYLVESILVTILCCMPFGIVGIVFASQVNTKFAAGDKDGALRSSENTKNWMTWGIVCSIIPIALYLLFLVFGISVLAIFN